MSQQPVILLTFSNNEDAYLPMIVAEQKAIKKALLDYADKNYLQLRDIQRITTEELFYLVNRYHNQLHILHYGGHANSHGLQLEKEIGIVQAASVKGLAGLLGTQKALKLVFLNGCATAGQVQLLLDQGVPAVLATRTAIEDEGAKQFATQFYEALSTGSTIREAFTKAKAFLEMQSDAYSIKPIPETRGFVLRGANTKKIPWGLYWKAEEEAILDWQLPSKSSIEIDFGTNHPMGQSSSRVNSILVDQTLRAVRESLYVKELARKINRDRQSINPSRKPTDAEKKDAIVRSYLAPISVHLRALFSEELAEKCDEPRLRQLVLTYQKTVALFCFIMLSDIWDARLKKRAPLQISEVERLQLAAFFNINAFTQSAFDYFQLADALLQIANRNEIQFYLDPLNKYPKGWEGNEQLVQANAHFLQMKTVLEEDIPSRLIEAYCMSSEQQLTNVICAWSFVLSYKMAVIKNIEVQQLKNMPPTSFKHALVELDNNYNDIGRKDQWQDLEAPTDMESVLLYRDRLNENLNLSPFVLDKNALIRAFNSKIYFFAHSSEAGLHYQWIENEADTLVISKDHFPQIWQQFEKARKDILNEAPQAPIRSEMNRDDDILSLM